MISYKSMLCHVIILSYHYINIYIYYNDIYIYIRIHMLSHAIICYYIYNYIYIILLSSFVVGSFCPYIVLFRLQSADV